MANTGNKNNNFFIVNKLN